MLNNKISALHSIMAFFMFFIALPSCSDEDCCLERPSKIEFDADLTLTMGDLSNQKQLITEALNGLTGIIEDDENNTACRYNGSEFLIELYNYGNLHCSAGSNFSGVRTTEKQQQHISGKCYSTIISFKGILLIDNYTKKHFSGYSIYYSYEDRGRYVNKFTFTDENGKLDKSETIYMLPELELIPEKFIWKISDNETCVLHVN